MYTYYILKAVIQGLNFFVHSTDNIDVIFLWENIITYINYILLTHIFSITIKYL